MSPLTLMSIGMASALLVYPGSPGRRLRSEARPRPVRAVIGCAAGGIGIGSMLLLPITTTLSAAILLFTVALRVRRGRLGQRANRESRELEGALEVLVGELSVGSHPVRAFGTAAAESSGAVSVALSRVAARARLGADVVAGLNDSARHSALPGDWRRLAAYWNLAGTHGLAIAALMRTAQRDISERQRFSDRVRSQMAGARTSAVILAGLPLLGIALGQLLGARPLQFLLGGHLGGVMLVFGIGLSCGGLLWADRITEAVVR